MNPFDKFIEKNDKLIKKTYIIYIDGEEKTCDACDEIKQNVASINTISGGVECLCKDCLKKFYEAIK
jgi:hypothetical protein